MSNQCRTSDCLRRTVRSNSTQCRIVPEPASNSLDFVSARESNRAVVIKELRGVQSEEVERPANTRPPPSTSSSVLSAFSNEVAAISAVTCRPINNSVFPPSLPRSIHSNHPRSPWSSSSSVAQQKSQRTNASARGKERKSR